MRDVVKTTVVKQKIIHLWLVRFITFVTSWKHKYLIYFVLHVLMDSSVKMVKAVIFAGSSRILKACLRGNSGNLPNMTSPVTRPHFFMAAFVTDTEARSGHLIVDISLAQLP